MAKMCLSLVCAVLVALLVHSNLVKASPEDGAILYDSSYVEEALEMPGPCAGQSYCFEKGENYPEEKIEELLADMQELKVDYTEPQTSIDSRNGDTYDEPDCLSNTTEGPIFYIIDNNDKVRVVVQSPKKFKQIYSVQWCRDEGRITRDTPHFLKSSNILQKFKIECVSTKMDFNFFVLSDEVDPDTRKPKMEIASAKFALSSLQLTNGAATKKIDDSMITFPGPIQDVSNRHGTADVSEKCKDKNFCTVKPSDYPQALFNRMFKGKFKEQAFQPTYVMTDDRQGDPDEVDDCATTVTYEPLYKVKTKQGDWRTVVQAPEENYVQMVRLESCKEVGSSCFTEFKVPLGFVEPFCKQKYNVWEFLVHDGKDGTEKVKVDLPVCCSCHYKNKD